MEPKIDFADADELLYIISIGSNDNNENISLQANIWLTDLDICLFVSLLHRSDLAIPRNYVNAKSRA